MKSRRELTTAIIVAAFLFGTLAAIGQDMATVARAVMPKIDDADLQSVLDDPAFKWHGAPKVFQHGFNTQLQFKSVFVDVGPTPGRMAEGLGNMSNANHEWPWAHPGTPRHDPRAKNLIGYKLVGLETFGKQFPQSRASFEFGYAPKHGTGWRYGAGTEFVELLTNEIQGEDYTFAIHRMTMQGNGEWLFRVYRPFTERSAYEKATNTKAVDKGKFYIQNEAHRVKVFRRSVDMVTLPPITPAKAKQLLVETPFTLARDESFVPTTKHAEQVYPRDYLGPWIGNAVNQEICRSCHRTVGCEAAFFAPGDWYGQLRGGGQDRHGAGTFTTPTEVVRR